MNIKPSNQKGFTLIELSIVIVIIGLIVAGVVGGQSLVRQAKLRSLISDIQQFKTAINAFKLEYGTRVLPGDMPNAEDYWGAGITNNGNNNRIIDGPAAINSETMYAWQHLSLAGLVQGNYIGSGNMEAGLNLPITPFGGVYMFNYHPFSGGFYNTIQDNSIMVGKFINTNAPWGATIKPKEAYNIDIKLDDGSPSSGSIIAFEGDEFTRGVDCVDADWDVANSANYILTSDLETCRMFFFNIISDKKW